MKRFLLSFVLCCVCQAFAIDQSPPSVDAKKAYGGDENFQDIMNAEKVTVCLLTAPPRDKNEPGPRALYPWQYQMGVAKELPATLTAKLRDTLSDPAAMCDPEEEELAGGHIGYVLRYSFHTKTRTVYLDFSSQMMYLLTWKDNKIVGSLWVNRPAPKISLRAIAKRIFPDAPSL
jgi:hypothetical protein